MDGLTATKPDLESHPSRTECDVLGEVALPADAVIGINTFRSLENFNVSGRSLGHCRALVRNLAIIKSAAARANGSVDALDGATVAAIVGACEEVAAGKHDDHLLCDLLEGSGGTSVNMNINEVIANVALTRLGATRGDYSRLHPNDHINLSQSTNDVVPSAVRLAVYEESERIVTALKRLSDALTQKQTQFAEVLRLGRTCMQDAQPMTLGQVFGGYATVIRRHAEQLEVLRSPLLDLPLGGTAIGTGFGVRQGYRVAVISYLAEITGFPIKAANDAFDAMQNADDCARLSSELKVTANSLWKLGNDLIILASGPEGGLGEIRLPRLQSGSSIMPGKINPVMPMTLCQVALAVNGNDLTVSLAAQQGLLDLNHYELLVADRLLDSLRMMTGAVDAFTNRCVEGIEADEARSWTHLWESSALATVLIPKLGYANVSALVQRAHHAGRPFVEEAKLEGHLTDEDVRNLLLRAALGPD